MINVYVLRVAKPRTEMRGFVVLAGTEIFTPAIFLKLTVNIYIIS